MGDHMKKSCEGSGVTEDAVPVLQLNCGEKSEFCYKLEDECRGEVELLDALSPAESGTSGCYEGDESTQTGRKPLESPDLKKVDWQAEGFGTEISTSVDGTTISKETPTSELCGDSEQVMVMESSSVSREKPTPPASPLGKPSTSAPKTPSAAELEEFFVAAEKYVQERFAEKYNYDVVKDVPLEGRYEWVRLHP